MTTFYDNGSIRITERWLHVGDQRYAVEELRNLGVARGAARPRAGPIILTTILASPVVGLLGNTASRSAAVAAESIVVVLTALATVWARRSRAYQLWADYRGSPVRLHETRDRTEFGKISRALVRASSHHRVPPRYVVRLAR
jgi:hypothetical protein